MPTCIRSAGVATAYVVMHSIMIMIVQVTPLALEVISWRYFLIFLISNAIFVVILYFYFPETKGKTLEEMNALFGDEASRAPFLSRFYGQSLTLVLQRLRKLSKKLASLTGKRGNRCNMTKDLFYEAELSRAPSPWFHSLSACSGAGKNDKTRKLQDPR